MANVTETVQYEAGVYQLETTDKPLGGAAGIANRQATQLANRTAWLRKHIIWGANNTYTTNTTLTAASAGQIHQLQTPSFDVTLTLPAISTVVEGDRFLFINGQRSGKTLTVQKDPSDGTIFSDYALNGTQKIIYPGESFVLMANEGAWRVVDQSQIFGLPSSMLAAFPVNSVPEGWLKCNGAAVSRSLYARLFSVIGTAYGTGDGSTTFNVPDYRGYFLRAWADGGSVDSGRSLASVQLDEFKSHTHTYFSWNAAGTAQTGASGGNFGSQQTSPTGGSETRPINISVLYCIKY